jgi:hypothetical protein
MLIVPFFLIRYFSKVKAPITERNAGGWDGGRLEKAKTSGTAAPPQ